MTALPDQQSAIPSELLTADDPRSPVIGEDQITPEQLVRLAERGGPLVISPRVSALIASARAIIDSVIESDEPSYGVNRGLGPLRDQAIPAQLQHDFQRFVFASHDAAVGPALTREEARAVLLARIAVMARGNSGASMPVFNALCALIENDVTPEIPGEGSVGAADLAALASVGAVLVGSGRVLSDEFGAVSASEALAKAGLRPVELSAKDAHSLVVANSASVGLGALASCRMQRFAAAADLAAASTIEAVNANINIFDEALMFARPHPGQIRSATRMRALFAGGDLAAQRVATGSLQDPLSIRTVPQVHGELLEQSRRLTDVLTIELNGMPENPYLDRESNRMISNGNFSSIRLSLALEQARLVLAHTAMLAERRVALMIGQLRSGRSLVEQITTFDAQGVPLVPVILANTASGLLARIQQLAAPVTLLGAAVGDGVEDHNAQAYAAARLLGTQLDLAERLLSVEVLVGSGLAALRAGDTPRVLGTTLGQLREGTLNVLGRALPGDTTNQRLETVQSLLLTLSVPGEDPHPDLLDGAPQPRFDRIDN